VDAAYLKAARRSPRFFFLSFFLFLHSPSSHSHLTFQLLSLSYIPLPQEFSAIAVEHRSISGLSCTHTLDSHEKDFPCEKSFLVSSSELLFLTVRERFEKRRSKDSQSGL
jgi:hypothetical protein